MFFHYGRNRILVPTTAGGGGGGGEAGTGAKIANGATYFTHGSQPTGVTDSAVWTVSIWLEPNTDSNDRTFMQWAGTAASLRQPAVSFDEGFGLWRIQLETDLGITSTPSALGGSPGFDGNWHHVLMWQDGSLQTQGGYLDGSANVSSNSINNATIDFTGTDLYWLATNAAGEILDGMCISELYINTDEKVDDPTKFRESGTGKPVSLGSDGSTPTGNQPAFYFSNGDMTTNLGYAGNPTKAAGADLSDCADAPAD